MFLSSGPGAAVAGYSFSPVVCDEFAGEAWPAAESPVLSMLLDCPSMHEGAIRTKQSKMFASWLCRREVNSGLRYKLLRMTLAATATPERICTDEPRFLKIPLPPTLSGT